MRRARSIQTNFDFFECGKAFGDGFVEDRQEGFYLIFGIDNFDEDRLVVYQS